MFASFQFDAAPPCPGPPELLAADIRLDNRAEVLRGLGLRESDAPSDADLVLPAYERWGEDCAAHLLGDFAFVLWDRRRARLFGARDPIGIRPLYYSADRAQFVCASAAEAVRVPPAPDRGAIALLLLDRFPAAPATRYEGVHSLPAGYGLIATAAGVRTSRYWDATRIAPARYRGEAEAVERFRELFTDAVRCRLSSAPSRSRLRSGTEPRPRGGGRPVATTLSGGLDSSAIAVVAGVEAYALAFDGLPCDESRYIDDVVRAAAITVHRYAPEADLARAAELPGVPWDMTFVMNAPLLAAASRNGVRALLWGFGGDELLTSGDAYLTDLFRRRRFLAAAGAVRAYARHYGQSPWRLGFDACVGPFLPASIRRLAPRRRPDWLRPHFVCGVEPADVGGRCFATIAQDRIWHSIASGRAIDYTVAEAGALAAAFGLEFRYPFYDRRLVEYALSLPAEYAYLLASKLALRDALAGILPDSVRGRLDKAGFDCWIDREFRGPQADTIASFIRNSELSRIGAIDAGALERRFEEYRREGGSRRAEIAVFIRVEAWLRSLRQFKKDRDDPFTLPRAASRSEEEAVLSTGVGAVR